LVMKSKVITDDIWCQVEFFADSQEVGIGLLQRTSSTKKSKELPTKWKEYLIGFTSSMSKGVQAIADMKAALAPSSRMPFLARNILRDGEASTTKLDSRLKEAMKKVYHHHGLTFRVEPATYKLHFNEGSEDVLFRSRQRDQTPCDPPAGIEAALAEGTRVAEGLVGLAHAGVGNTTATETKPSEGVKVPAWKAKIMSLRIGHKKKFDAWLENNFPENLKVGEPLFANLQAGDSEVASTGSEAPDANAAVGHMVKAESSELSASAAMQGMATS